MEKMKITLNLIGITLTPIGMILAQFNRPLGAALLGAAVALILTHIFQHYELKKKEAKWKTKTYFTFLEFYRQSH